MNPTKKKSLNMCEGRFGRIFGCCSPHALISKSYLKTNIVFISKIALCWYLARVNRSLVRNVMVILRRYAGAAQFQGLAVNDCFSKFSLPACRVANQQPTRTCTDKFNSIFGVLHLKGHQTRLQTHPFMPKTPKISSRARR